MTEKLPEFIKEQGVDIAGITTPSEAAREIATQLYQYGVRGFWNFANIRYFFVSPKIFPISS